MTDWRQPRTLEDFGGYDDLTPAEQKALDELDSGQFTILGNGELPGPDAGPMRQIRATFLRWLILETSLRRHEKGVEITGALIVSDGPERAETRGLDLEGCWTDSGVALFSCRFGDVPLMRTARLGGLFLNGSSLPGLSADGIEATGGIFLRDVRSEGEIRLPGARIGGDLDCGGATLRNDDGWALTADGLETTGGVFLNGVESGGEIRLVGARIGSNLSGIGAKLLNEDGKAFNAGGAAVEGALFWRDGAVCQGALDLTAARLGYINDDPDCWPGPGDLLLDRCVYGAFTGRGSGAADRIRWLGLQDPARWGDGFWPQPWEQCAKVLRETGRPADARAVLIDKERRQRAARRAELALRLKVVRLQAGYASGTVSADDINAEIDLLRQRGDRESERRANRLAALLNDARILRGGEAEAEEKAAEAMRRAGSARGDRRVAARAGIVGLWLKLTGHHVWDCVTGAVIGYGRKPELAAVWAICVWLLGAGVFAWVEGRGGLMPNNPFVLRSKEWATCAGLDPVARYDCFSGADGVPSYPDFQPLIYSADTLLPVMTLHQEAHWIPDSDVPEGAVGRAYLWFHIFLGWALSLLAVAGFSGLVKSD